MLLAAKDVFEKRVVIGMDGREKRFFIMTVPLASDLK